MGVIHAKLYALTGEDEYRRCAVRTADALAAEQLDANGVYLNDRDAWTEGTFAGEWARSVLTLAGTPHASSRHPGDNAATGSPLHHR
jgi:hypothetical protein